MTKRLTILALVGFAILPQLSHGFAFLSGNSYDQKEGVFNTGPPAGESLYGLDYSRAGSEPFSLSAPASGPWSGMNSFIPSTQTLNGLTVDSSPRAAQSPPDPIPEPATLFLVGLGLIGTGVYKRYARRS